MATAGKVTVAEVEEILKAGELDPDQIHTPGIYINRIVKGKTIAGNWKSNSERKVSWNREQMCLRASQELKDGDYVNLGIECLLW